MMYIKIVLHFSVVATVSTGESIQTADMMIMNAALPMHD